MVSAFEKGAKEAGHEVIIFAVARMNVKGCLGCEYCHNKGEGKCVQQDDMKALYPEFLSADMVVFATPLYYFGMSAQLKSVVDRFCAFSHSLRARHLKSALIAVAWDDYDWTFEALESHYRTLLRYIDLEDRGILLAGGCGTPAETADSEHLRRAYEFGKSLKE